MNRVFHRVNVESYEVSVYIGGDFLIRDAESVAQSFCDRIGMCVSISKTRFVYTGGACSGVRVGFINYGRFPSTRGDIFRAAVELAEIMVCELGQDSASVVATDRTVWISRRAEDVNPPPSIGDRAH